jgi:alpha,alpha-trehalase
MVPLDGPAATMAAYKAENPQGKEALTAFVAKHFLKIGEQDQHKLTMLEHIRALWPILAKPPMAATPGSSLLQLPYAYVVAGGRYQEMYYWDSYFTMLGLKEDGEQPLIDSMLANFVSMIDRYGHIPNGTRSYYLSRSQPPFLALMMDLSVNKDPTLARQRLAALKGEHAYWMAGSTCLGADSACQHVIRMPDGSLLNRYWDARDTPRDESYVEDIATSAQAAPRPAGQTNRDLRAGAESGWDYSSRWLRDQKTLSTIHTTDIVPVDLNSLLWSLEMSIARRCKALGDTACAQDFTRQADARKAAISKWLWSAQEQRFVDWDRTKQATKVISAAMLYPLFVGLATPAQAQATARLTQSDLLAPGGLRTTTIHNGQQWDQPNGWAPLTWVAVEGCAPTGRRSWPRISLIAGSPRFRPSTTAPGAWSKNTTSTGDAGGGGEYPVQDGFGWTNGVTRALTARYPRSARA